MFKNVKNGFTLAEVLIVIGIIGVVANVTIPSLIANQQKAQYVTRAKKAYTQANQVLSEITNDYGTPGDLKATGLFSAGTTSVSLGQEFVKHYKTAKICGKAYNGGCWSTETYYSIDRSEPTSYSNLDDGTYNYNFVTEDGMSVIVYNYANNGLDTDCKVSYTSNSTGNLRQVCGAFVVDVNGLKGPNCYGRDVWNFYISNGKGAILYPRGGKDDSGSYWGTYCKAGSTMAYTCAGRLMEEGWQMNY